MLPRNSAMKTKLCVLAFGRLHAYFIRKLLVCLKGQSRPNNNFLEFMTHCWGEIFHQITRFAGVSISPENKLERKIRDSGLGGATPISVCSTSPGNAGIHRKFENHWMKPLTFSCPTCDWHPLFLIKVGWWRMGFPPRAKIAHGARLAILPQYLCNNYGLLHDSHLPLLSAHELISIMNWHRTSLNWPSALGYRYNYAKITWCFPFILASCQRYFIPLKARKA